MISFSEFLNLTEDTVTHGWTTKRHADGYDWEVHKWEYGKDKKTMHSGKEATREKAVEKAKTKHKGIVALHKSASKKKPKK